MLSPKVTDNKIDALNFINEFNHEVSKGYIKRLSLEDGMHLIKMSGLYVSNEAEEFQLRIETNSE